MAAYLAPNGHYSDSSNYFYDPPATGGNVLNSPPLHAVQATDTTTNGFYSYSASSTFPTNTYNATNYYVDVAFSPSSAPGTVTNVTAKAGSSSALVSWTAPSTGGPATTYTVTTYYGTTAEAAYTVTGSPAPTSFTFPGLLPGYPYTFKVTASNPDGSGPASASSNAVTPFSATVAGAPTGVTALPATHEATVSWTAPANNGGAAVSGYTITPYIGTTAQTPTTTATSATSAAVTGLTNGVAYTFTVAANNIAGTGPASAPTAPSRPPTRSSTSRRR